MNREILFKAKRKDNGEWVEGNLITNERNENQKYIGYIFDERNGVIEDFDLVEVIPTTICQYTGLTDKNGKKIWENDIVNRTDLHVVSEPSIGFIEYDLENTSFLIHWTNKVEYSPTYHWKDKLQVIGNIFDNPELLEMEAR